MTIFRSSKEAYDLGTPLVRLFVTALGRVPNATDMTALLARRRRGAELAGIAGLLAAGAEFTARHGPSGPPDEHYLRALFWAVDGQDPAQEDAALLTPGATRASVLLAVSQTWRTREAISLSDTLYPNGLPPEDDLAYQLWLDSGRPSEAAEDGVAMARHAASLPPALFSLILPVPPVRPDLLEETVASLAGQIWPHWECLLICPDTLPPHVQEAAKALAARVPAVRVITAACTLPPADAVNRALAESSGVMVGWLGASDCLAPAALYEAASVLAGHPQTRLIYTDEDCIAGDGTRFRPAFKAGWSPDLALMGDCFGQLVLLDRQSALAQGGFSAAAAPFERYALCLRVGHDAPPGSIHHIPAVLFHQGRRRDAAASRFPEARAVPAGSPLGQVVARHLRAHHPSLSIAKRLQGTLHWPTLLAALPDPPPRVSVIIPIRDRAALLERCLQGVLTQTDYPDLEVLIVDNGSEEAETLALLQRARHDKRVRVLAQPGVFNWSALNNAGVAQASGEVLLLLNNDVEVLEPDWLARLAGHAIRRDVGVVGARLLFPDGTLQHGGILLGPKGQAVHAMTHAGPGEAGYLGQVALPRDLSAVTGACLALRRTVFDEVGGLEAQAFRVGWSDIDLCLKVRQAGYRVLWLPDAVLTHREMATRGRDVSALQQTRHEIERAALRRRWPAEIDRDPFLNPNLEATATGLVLANPSRRLPPWVHTEDAAA